MPTVSPSKLDDQRAARAEQAERHLHLRDEEREVLALEVRVVHLHRPVGRDEVRRGARGSAAASAAAAASTSRTSPSTKVPAASGSAPRAAAGTRAAPAAGAAGSESAHHRHAPSAPPPRTCRAVACTKPPGASQRWTDARGGAIAQLSRIS